MSGTNKLRSLLQGTVSMWPELATEKVNIEKHTCILKSSICYTRRIDMKNNLRSLCWNITEKCNENCKFCYRKKCKDNTLQENIKIFDNLSQINIEKISFCGGEPLLYKDLFSLVKYIHEKKPDIKLSITTNGKCINDNLLEEILKYFDWISFPLDSSNADINETIGRGYEHTTKIIQLLEKCNNKIKIKVNTVVNKINKDDLKNIYQIISRYNISRWKIFRFFPIRGAKDYRDIFYIENNESKEVQNLIKILNERSSFNIEYNDFEEDQSCFSIQPDGTLENNNNEVIGNFLENSIIQLLELKRLETKNFNNLKKNK